MNKHEEKRAKELEYLLKKGGDCHDPALGSLQEISKSLSGLSKADASDLSPEVMAKQRALLMSKSHEIKQANVASKEPTKSPVRTNLKESVRQFIHSWKMAVASFGTVVLVTAVIVMLVLPRGITIYPGSVAVRRVSDLLIPAAMATDAFAFEAEIEDAGGVSTSTTFLIRSKIDLSVEALSSHLVVIPAREAIGAESSEAVAVRVEKKDAETFRVTPVSPLDPGTVYRVEIRGAIQREDGELQARTFSWAIQTKDVFRVLSSVPSDASNSVPVNTVIEVTVNTDRWTDPATHFQIIPSVKGTFRTAGRTVTFVPDQPLAYGTVYTATWTKDWGVKESDVNLGSDYVVRFETISKVRADAEQSSKMFIDVMYPYIGATPGKMTRIPMYFSEEGEMKIEGYRLSGNEATSYLIESGKRPSFGRAARDRADLEISYAKQFAFSVTSTIGWLSNWVPSVSLPDTIPSGFYLLKLTSVAHAEAIPGWVFMNVTDKATYLMADEDQSIVWVMDSVNARPMQGISVTDGVQTAKTDVNGIARLKTPEFLTQENSTSTPVIIRVGEGGGETLMPLASDMGLRMSWWSNMWETAADKTVSYLHVDRPLYHPSDTMEVSGLIQDRSSGLRPAEPVTVALMRGCSMWSCDMNREGIKTYESVTVTPDEKGFFRASISWSDLGETAYNVVLKRGDEPVKAEGVEVRDFVKPEYVIENTLNDKEVFAGDALTGSARATFFEGTPLANLALRVSSALGGKDLKTDEDGSVSYSFATKQPECRIDQDLKSRCPVSSSVYFDIASKEAESTWETDDSDSATVWNTDIQIVPDWKATYEGRKATISLRAEKIELPMLYGGRDLVPVAQLEVHAVVEESWWERRQTGTNVDDVQKTTYPVYAFDKHEEIVSRQEIKTDAEGASTLSFETKPGRFYSITFYAKDGKGNWSVAYSYVYASERSDMTAWEHDNSYSWLTTTDEYRNAEGYRINEKVSLSIKTALDETSQILPSKDSPSYLYVKTALGIKDVTVSRDATIEFPFLESYIPNIYVFAVVFRNGGFSEYSTYVPFQTEDRKLNVDLSLDRDSYAPGEEATVHVKVKDPLGGSKEGVRVALVAVDEALFKASFYSVDEDALRGLYESVGSRIVYSGWTHRDNSFFGGGGGEMGGGGGDAPRKNFKDTAGYEVVTTDRNGEAEWKIRLPDNITTWRLSGIAMSSDRYAGTARSAIKVTKELFVSVVVPETFLASDVPQMKLRAYGKVLKTGEAIAYIVDAPSLGIRQQKIRSKVGESVYVPIEYPVVGTHAITVRLETESASDTLEKRVTIMGSRFERSEGVQSDATKDMGIDIGSASDVRLSFVPKTRAQYLQDLYDMHDVWNQRVETMIASRVSGSLLRNYFGEDIQDVEASGFSLYQQGDGGISILAHASSDVALSSRASAISLDGFNRDSLAKYFREQLQNSLSPRESQIEALAGLAALGEPVLIDLRIVAGLQDLNWRERLAVMRGFVAIGDVESARPFLNAFLDGRTVQDGMLFVDVSDQEKDNQVATVQIASYAIRLGDARADALGRAVQEIKRKGLFAPLAFVDYLRVAVPSAIGGETSVTYQVSNQKTKIDMADGNPKTILLTASEATSFKVTDVQGSIQMTYLKRVSSKPKQDARITLTRTYKQGNASSLTAFRDGGDPMTIQLSVSFAKDAPEGCYTVQDHIPAGFTALTGWKTWSSTGLAYVSPFEAQDPTFVVCTDRNKPIEYRIKPTARGTYLAEPAVVQSMEYPDVTALSDEIRVTIE